MTFLADYLEISETEEDELFRMRDEETPGSCQWLLKKQSFLDWRSINGQESSERSGRRAYDRDFAAGKRRQTDDGAGVRFFWLTGPPGTGKSYLAAHVARYLEDS